MHKKNRYKAIVAFVVALAFMLPTSAMFANDVTNDVTSQVTKVRFEPPSQTVETGETFTASYYIEPTDWIIGANFVNITFDPTLLQADSVTKGTFFGGKEIMFSGGAIDNTLGTISDGFALVLVADAVNADGSVFVISFTAKDKLGTSALVMNGVTIKNNTGVSIPITVESGSVTVGETVMLTIGVDGQGTTVPVPGVHNCTPGTVVDLEAIHDLGWSFDHWTGDVADPNSAITNITMNENKVVTAYFTEDCYTLTVSTVGDGVVNVDPDKECYLYGESVNLTAIADSHWTFEEWSGDLMGDENPEAIIMDGDKAVTATFTKDQCVLDIAIIGSGTVTKNPDQETYAYGTSVNLTAVPDACWEFKEWSGDLSGNETHETIIMDGDKDVTATFKGDTISPVSEHILEPPEPNGDNGWYTVPVKVTLIATDEGCGVASIWYRWEDHIYKWYSEPFIISGDKIHTLEYFSIDSAGNIEDVNKVVIKIDTTPPVTTIEFDGLIGDNGWFISDVTVTLSARDVTSGVNYTMYKIDDDWITYTGSFNVTEDGEYTIYYYSVDLAGNEEMHRQAILKIEKDIPPPETHHEFSGIMGDNGWYVSDVTVTLIAIDYGSGVDYTMYKLDDGEWTEYNDPFLAREDGEHELRYYSVDKVGNIEAPPKSATFKIDKTAPTIELTWDGENSKLVADVSDETSGIAKVEFYVNDEYLGNATEYPYEWIVPNPKTGDKGQAIVYDNAGNEAISPPINAVSQGNSQSQSNSNLVPVQRRISGICLGGLTGIQNTQRRV